MIFAMSDIHGQYDLLEKRIEQIKPLLKEKGNKLILLGDYIDDENIPEEEVEWCTIGTPDYVMTGKYPLTVGHFYKDIIAGHVAASLVAGDKDFKGIYFDGESHYYIDGQSGKNKRILCLAYNEAENKYYELDESGDFCAINKRVL